MSKLIRLSIRTGLVVLALSLASACSRGGGYGKEGQGKAPAGPPGRGGGPVPVVAGKVTRETVPVTLSTFGNVEAYATVAVRSQINGLLSEVHFKDGQYVQAGDLLLVIDPRLFQAALDAAQANLQRDMAQSRLAHVELERAQRLFKTGVDTKEDLDRAQATADSSDATVAADKASVANAALFLGYSRIYSPIDGRTGALLINQGNAIKANDVPIMTINQVKPIHVAFSLPEQDLPRVRRYMGERALRVDVSIPGDSGPPETGALDFLDNSVESTTGTFTVKGVFPNADERLWPGQYVSVELYLTTIPDAVLAPTQAVQTGQSGKYAFVVKPDMTVESRTVATSETVGGRTVIVEGLAPGETVVTDGQLRLVAGAKVELKSPVTGAAPGPSGPPGAPAAPAIGSSAAVESTASPGTPPR